MGVEVGLCNAAKTLHALLAFRMRSGDRPTVLRNYKRTDLPGLCCELGFRSGAEIGVWRGAFSELFCKTNPGLHLLCVDPWEPHQAWIDTKNALPREKAVAFMEESYRDARTRLDPLNCTIVRKYSTEAAKDVPDGSLDFAYIDANHVYAAVMEDLTAWTPKVRSGGFVAGHDFRVNPKKPFIQVVDAVTEFTRAHGINPWFVLAGERTPSFLWVRP